MSKLEELKKLIPDDDTVIEEFEYAGVALVATIGSKNGKPVEWVYMLGGKDTKPRVKAFYISKNEAFNVSTRKDNTWYMVNMMNDKLKKDKLREETAKVNAGDFFKVGDILVCTWGATMRIVDFYKVKAVGNKQLKVVEIGQTLLSGDGQNGTVTANPDSESDVQLTCNIIFNKAYSNDDTFKLEASVKIEGHIAHHWDGKPEIFYGD
jgi:hypothetical protein